MTNATNTNPAPSNDPSWKPPLYANPTFNTDPFVARSRSDSPAGPQAASPTAQRARLVRAAALRSVFIGLGVCLLGIVVTAATYSSASDSSGGGHYVVAWGAIVFGALRAVRSIPALIRGK